MSPPIQTNQPEYEPSNAELYRFMDKRFGEIDDRQDRHADRLRIVEDALLGTIKPPRQGFINRVRSLEKQIGAARKLAWTAIVAAAGAMGTWAAGKFTGKN